MRAASSIWLSNAASQRRAARGTPTGEERLGQGREAAKATLRQNPEMREELENKVREAFEIPIPTRTAEEADAVTPVAKPKKK